MICNEDLKARGLSYPRTCQLHGIGGCPPTDRPRATSDLWIERYYNAKGQVDRQWIVDEIVSHDEGIDAALHALLASSARLAQGVR